MEKEGRVFCQPCPALKLWSNRVGSLLCFWNAPKKYRRLDAKLETKMMELKRSSQGKATSDEDSNGTIDREELKKCIKKLQFHVKEEEIDDLFHSCDVDEKEGIQFNEFIVLLSYLSLDGFILYIFIRITFILDLEDWLTRARSTFNTIVEAFLFLDKSVDGKLHKKDVVKALNEDSPCEKSPSHVTQARFKEMDWDRSSNVSFRQFLFAFLDWVGIDTDDENHTT
ncbi:hypothetical protein RND71_040049 [Anisodus tanguticus]|uniref:EF-hand domain-containing protein n=1 Tax=Anisodus tanguticus TaxID=243964 RepID=A0AAE1QXY1_9SOLA|nr:hypothetical protein RND71_040049 [Anisodus tanguticus]